MLGVILGFPAVALLMLGAIRARREYLSVRDTVEFIRGTPRHD